MKEPKSNESRRKLLRTIAAGSGAIIAGKSLPDSWVRPVVDSVMLPAHAQTSTAPPACAYTITMVVTGGIDGVMADGGSYNPQNAQITGQISPNPGVGIGVDLLLLYDGVPVDTGATVTDASGAWSAGYGFGLGGAGIVETVTVTPASAPYNCATASWSATVI